MTTYLLIGLAFASGFMLVFGANMLLADIAQNRRMYLHDQVTQQMAAGQEDRARREMERFDVDELSRDDINPRLATMDKRLQRILDQAGLRMRVTDLAVVSLCVGLVPAISLYIVLDHLVAALAVAFAGGALPLAIVVFLRNRRMEKLLSQLPDAFDLMSRVLRAGQTMSQALQAVAEEFSDPIATEFGYCHAQQNLGLTPEAALRDLAHRTELLDIKIFVVAVSVHRETGGNMAVLLERLATVIRIRYRIRGQIRALTAEGKLQAYILIALPFIVLAALMLTSRDYVVVLFQYPWLLGGMIIADVLGALWMRQIINFDF